MTLPKVAYFSMEMAIDQSLHTYSGGLGYLAGSHMRSAYQLGMPMVGITILWAKGYGEQELAPDGCVRIVHTKRNHSFLNDTGIVVEIKCFGEPVKIKALKLEPETFGTVPIYFLTTDLPENDEKHRSLTDILYDSDEQTRIMQEMVLGMGGFKVLEALKEAVDVFHINEGHGLPALFELLDRCGGNLEAVKKRAVFTTHTPVMAGNETHPTNLLYEAGYFSSASLEKAIDLGGEPFSLTVAALRMCRLANAVSQLHGKVANQMWRNVHSRCPIIAITNSVDLEYWQDPLISQAQTDDQLRDTKKQMKQRLFERIQAETGKSFKPNVLTIVWARRFTEYKRPTLIFRDINRLRQLLKQDKIQLVFAGKFHPSDGRGQDLFNEVLNYSRQLPNMAVLLNYELELSKQMKCGADVWLNTPLRPMEASGTSGMSANMNGAIHFSIYDGWAVEGTFHHVNGLLINEEGHCDMCQEYCDCVACKVEDRNQQDYEDMMNILENEIIPAYYADSDKMWISLMKKSIKTANTFFNSERMVLEYYNRMYHQICPCP